MSLWEYLRRLVQAAYDSQRASIRESTALERFFRRNGWMFSAEEKSWVEATVGMSGWQTLGYNILQERRDAAGLPADPKRLAIQPSAVGLGVRALMFPRHYLQSSTLNRRNTERRRK